MTRPVASNVTLTMPSFRREAEQSHRNRMTTHTVEVSIEGVRAYWADGEFSGDDNIIQAALDAVNSQRVYSLHGNNVICTADTALGALAALSVTSPGRTVVLQAPGEVLALVFRGFDDDVPYRTLATLSVDEAYTSPLD